MANDLQAGVWLLSFLHLSRLVRYSAPTDLASVEAGFDNYRQTVSQRRPSEEVSNRSARSRGRVTRGQFRSRRADE